MCGSLLSRRSGRRREEWGSVIRERNFRGLGIRLPPRMAGFWEHPMTDTAQEEKGSMRREREECAGARGRRLHRGIVLVWMLLLQLPISACNDLYVVGYNDYGQLGLGDYMQRSTQTKMIGK